MTAHSNHTSVWQIYISVGVFSFGSVSDSLNQPQVPSEGDETGETADQGPEEGDDDPVVTFSNYAHCWTSSLAPFASIEHLDRGW